MKQDLLRMGCELEGYHCTDEGCGEYVYGILQDDGDNDDEDLPECDTSYQDCETESL